MSYYFECETRNIGNGAARACDYEVVETVDMDIFLEFLEDYHEKKWKNNSWHLVQMCKWKGTDVIWGEPKRIRAYKRYVEHAWDTCFSNENYGKSPIYKAYSYFIAANYNQ